MNEFENIVNEIFEPAIKRALTKIKNVLINISMNQTKLYSLI